MLDMLSWHRVDPKTGEKRLNLELFLPLGGMIVVGLTALTLGVYFYEATPPPEDEPYQLPTLEQFEERRQQALPRPDRSMPPVPVAPQPALDAGIDAIMDTSVDATGQPAAPR